MGELRKDYILDRWVIYSEGRGARPKEFTHAPETVKEGTCFFCPGGEALTPGELGRIGTKQKWRVRWFANKFPALEPAGQPKPKTDNRFFTHAANYGYHEVIVETPDHAKQLADLSPNEIADVLGVYQNRVAELSKKKSIAYVSVIKNHGYHAGTSIVHSHSQVFATAFVPPEVQEKVEARRRFLKCPHCDIVKAETNSARQCFETKNWLAFCPYASRFNYELWLYPKKHIRQLSDVPDLAELASLLKRVLGRLHVLNCSYNLFVTVAPQGEDLHLHIEVLPQIAIWGGFERGSGAVINSVMPESAAKFYRGEE